MKINMPKNWPVTIGSIRKRQMTTVQKNEFKICAPAYREVSEYFGLKKRILLIHLKTDGKWNYKEL